MIGFPSSKKKKNDKDARQKAIFFVFEGAVTFERHCNDINSFGKFCRLYFES